MLILKGDEDLVEEELLLLLNSDGEETSGGESEDEIRLTIFRQEQGFRSLG